MKRRYIKLFEEFITYQEIKEDTYAPELTKREDFTESEYYNIKNFLDSLNLKNYSMDEMQGNMIIFTFNRKGIITIRKYANEWYEVSVNYIFDPLKSWYKCDQLSSVKDVIKDIIK